MRNLSFWIGVEPTPSALEGEILTTGLPGKFLFSILSVVYRGGIYRSCSNSILFFFEETSCHFPQWLYILYSHIKKQNRGQLLRRIKVPIFPHVPQQLFSVLFFDSSHHPNRSEVVSFWSFRFAFPKWLVILNNFLRAYWPLVYHLWRTLEEILNNDMT